MKVMKLMYLNPLVYCFYLFGGLPKESRGSLGLLLAIFSPVFLIFSSYGGHQGHLGGAQGTIRHQKLNLGTSLYKTGTQGLQTVFKLKSSLQREICLHSLKAERGLQFILVFYSLPVLIFVLSLYISYSSVFMFFFTIVLT